MDNGSQTAVGTPDELRLLNLPLTNWGSCAPESTGVKGCPDYHRCIFAQQANGGFRDKGPRNVGVLKVNNERGAAREDAVECFTYMRYMHDHTRAENSVLSFAVIAQEGETIDEDVETPADPNNTKTGNMKMKLTTRKLVIPPFPRPGMPGSKVAPQSVRAQATLKRHAERLAKQRQEEATTRSLAQSTPPPMPPNPEDEVYAAASPTEMVPGLPPAPIIPRRRGRPPKPRG